MIRAAFLLMSTAYAVEEMSPMMIDGHDALHGKYGYMAQMRHGKEYNSQCGGSLIAPRFLLTAAHCEVNSNPIRYVTLDEYYNTQYVHPSKLHKVKRVIVHPEYHPVTLTHDFAVIELEHAVENIKPVYLANYNALEEQPEQQVTLTGWGMVDGASTPEMQQLQVGSVRLQEDDYTLINTVTCLNKLEIAVKAGEEDYENLTLKQKLKIKLLKSYNSSSPSIICVDSINGEGACFGDSGGPLVVNKNDPRPIQVGVVSFGTHLCGIKDEPTTFSRVSIARPFIDSVAYGQHWHGEAYPVAYKNDVHTKNDIHTKSLSSMMRPSISVFLLVIVIYRFL